ncbi:MAG: phosphoglycerate kinase, partial [Candidatus Sungbacteria bacterium]|nr:phosphoglycerate kinase [Candidatus Sungbacteria bacterium]
MAREDAGADFLVRLKRSRYDDYTIMRSVRGLRVKGKRVLLRVDFNLPPGEDFDIQRTAPTIRWLSRKGAKVLLLTHLGRPAGKRDPKLSTRQLLSRIQKAVGQKISFLDDCVGPKVEHAVEAVNPGGVLLFENVRFYPGEEKNDALFAKKLAHTADLYVNEAFGASHREHASIVALVKFLPSYAGPLFAKEVRTLSRLTSHPLHPLVVVIGGAKVETKLP